MAKKSTPQIIFSSYPMCIIFSLHCNIYLLYDQNCSWKGKIWYFMNSQIRFIYGLRIMKLVSSLIHLWQKISFICAHGRFTQSLDFLFTQWNFAIHEQPKSSIDEHSPKISLSLTKYLLTQPFMKSQKVSLMNSLLD